MLLKDSQGQLFQIRVIEYQYSEMPGTLIDANRLMTGLLLKSSGQTYALQLPCLQTSEVVELICWLKKLQAGEKAESSLDFLEPTVSFKHIQKGDGAAIRVLLRTGSGLHEADFDLNEIDLAKSIVNLREKLLLYPQRSR